MMEYLVAILAGGGFTFIMKAIETYFARKDKKEEDAKKEEENKKKEAEAEILKIMESIHRDGKRTQLMLLISDYPDRVDEIMEVAKKYFVDLHGNWYAHDIFSKFLEEKGIEKPNWYK